MKNPFMIEPYRATAPPGKYHVSCAAMLLGIMQLNEWNSGTIFKLVAGKRLLYRPLTGTTEVASMGIARVSKGDVTPAGEEFCEILRKISKWGKCVQTKAGEVLNELVPFSCLNRLRPKRQMRTDWANLHALQVFRAWIKTSDQSVIPFFWLRFGVQTTHE